MIWITLAIQPACWAELNEVFSDVFRDILVDQLYLSPGAHAGHFRPAAAEANQYIVPGLNSLITNEISSVPVGSTPVNVVYNVMSTDDEPFEVINTLGPIMAHNAEMMSQGSFEMGISYSRMEFNDFRGLDTEDFRFTFTHQDVTGDGTLGESPNESDTLDVYLGLNVNVDVMAYFLTYSFTNQFEVSVIVPYVQAEIEGEARAVVNSFTLESLGSANHHFQGNLNSTVRYSEKESGLGDVILRAKYNYITEGTFKHVLLAEIQLPTGDEDNYLGSGETNFKIMEVLSKNFDASGIEAHLNIGYERRGSDESSDEIEFAIGANKRISKKLTIAADILGDFDLQDDESVNILTGSRQIVDRRGGTLSPRSVDLSNVPEDDADNDLNFSLGLRYKPFSRSHFLVNVLIPLNDAGLNADVITTVGFGMSF